MKEGRPGERSVGWRKAVTAAAERLRARHRSHLGLVKTLCGQCYAHFVDKETEAYKVSHSGSYQLVTEWEQT